MTSGKVGDIRVLYAQGADPPLEKAGRDLTPAAQPLFFPCSSSQQRCWFINSLDPESPALNIALRWEVTGRFSPQLVERAFQTIIDRHEVLRTRFLERAGEPAQEVAETLAFKLSVIDLSALPKDKQLAEAQALGEQEAHKPFDIGQLPLIRVTLLGLSPDHAFLHVTVHQIVFDGWSIRILAHEFGEIAAALNANRAHDLPELQLQYGDYCLWQKEYLASGIFEAETAYWKNRLAGAPYFEAPSDYPRPARPSYRGEILAAILDPTLGEKLEEAARTHNLTLFSFGCAVTAAMLHRYTDQTDVIFGTQIAGRDEEDLEDMIGVFINNLVMRFDASGDPTFEQFLTRVNEIVQDALIHQRMPFHQLVKILNPPRDPRRTPLISVNFTVLRDVMDHKAYGDFVLRGHPSLSAGSLYDLSFFMVHWPNGWRMALEYNPDLFERRTAELMLEFLVSTFRFAIYESSARLSTLVPPPRERIASPSEARAPDQLSSPAAPAAVSSARLAEVETRMGAIWREALRLPHIEPTANFFEIGGHSLLTVRLLAKVASGFGVKADVMTLLQAPTLREFSAAIASAFEPPPTAEIIRIQPDGDLTPIFSINNSVLYYTLAKKIGKNRPFLGIPLIEPEIVEQEIPRRSLTEIAADYVRVIRAEQPHGPYVLIGLCVAAAIAYEAAQQLRQAGEKVPLIVMCDLWRPGYIQSRSRVRRWIYTVVYHLHVFRHRVGLIRSGKRPLVDVLSYYTVVRKSRILDYLGKLGLVDLSLRLAVDMDRFRFLVSLETARNAYEATAFDGDMVLLQSDEILLRFVDPDMDWRNLVKGQFIRERIKGWHEEIFVEPGASRIAEILRPLLEKVDAERKHQGPATSEPSDRASAK